MGLFQDLYIIIIYYYILYIIEDAKFVEFASIAICLTFFHKMTILVLVVPVESSSREQTPLDPAVSP